MKHEEVKRLLPDYSVGRLRGRIKDEVERHISECPTCERELRELQQVGKLLRHGGLLRPSNPQLLLNRIRDATQKVHEPSRQVWGRKVSWQWLLKPVVGFAILTLILAGAFLLWHQTPERPDLTVNYEQYHRLASWGNPLGNWIETGLINAGAAP